MATVTKVEFYINNNKVAEDTSALYSYLWAANVSGSVAVKVKAIFSDDTFKEKTVNITVGADPGTGGASGYLLDDFGDVGGGFALSLNKKLRSDYTGNLFRVEDNSLNTLDIGFSEDTVDLTAYNSFKTGKAEIYITTIYGQGATQRNWTASQLAYAPRIRFDNVDSIIEGQVCLWNKDANDFLNGVISGISTASLFVKGRDNTGNRFTTAGGQDNSKIIAQGAPGLTGFDMNGGAGTPSVYIDGTQLTDTSRDSFSTAFTGAALKKLSIMNLDLSGWTQFNGRYFSDNYHGMERISDLILWDSDKSSQRSQIESAL